MGISRRARVFGALGAAALLFVAACGDDDDTETGDGGDSGGGTLQVCSDTPYEPFEFEGEDGEQTGFDIEIMREIATRLDRELEVVDQPFDTIFAAPAAGDCDVVASAATITDEREENVDFTDPYFDADQSLLVKAEDEATYGTLEDLAGQTIGVQAETTGETYANDNKPEGATVKSYPDADGMFLALESGEVKALLQDLPVNAYRASQQESFVVTETFSTGEQYGFAVEEGNKELLDDLNAQLSAMREDGTYDEIYAEWFGEVPA